ncbi:MAG: amidohydrolase [Syntrophales bacterium]|jgi:5-methylthioadenosine/S-adenosylhomocysteine deaminase|nr:amidohydrolase [Syntrophales bacterium]
MTVLPAVREVDLIIRGGTALTMSPRDGIVEDPLIIVDRGKILHAAPWDPQMERQYRPKETLSAKGRLILPGLVNTHTHLPMVCFRGMADDLPLMSWLRDHIFPVEAKFINRETVYAGSILAIAEMILSGTTTCCDAYFHESSVARAAVASGFRLIPCQGFLDAGPKPGGDLAAQMEVARGFLDKWRGPSPLIVPALACHAAYTCRGETLQAIKKIAREENALFMIHLAETREEVEEVRSRFGTTPVRYLQKLGVLDDQTLAVHCNWIDSGEIDILAECDVKISHNPESNMKLAAGMAPVPTLLLRGLDVGLGTDGAASNNNLDLFGEMSIAARYHKLKEGNPTVMDATVVTVMATVGGARALRLDAAIGSIEPGKAADLILLDLSKPHLTPMYNPYSHLVYAASGSDVSDSVINGRIVMRDRKLLTIDADAAMEEVRAIARTIGRKTSV